MKFYVDQKAMKQGNGTIDFPFKHISDAAKIAQPGDEVIVAPGIYREYVNPANAGTEEQRITYRSAVPLGAVITGAERMDSWQHYEGNTWVCRVDNGVFGNYNPYTTMIGGDWYFAPVCRHTGAVYLNDKQLYENLPLLLDIPIVKIGHTDDDYPLGTGPYIFQNTVAGAQLKKVESWWCKDSAKLSTNAQIITLSEASSQAQVRDEFEFEDLDLAISNPMSDSYAEYRCDYELWEVDSGLFLYIGVNALWSEFFKDGRNDDLRKALTYAIDRETIIDTYYRGRAYASTLPTSPGSPYYSESLASRYEYDPLRFVSAIQNMYIPKDKNGNNKKLLLLVNCDDSARLRTARYIAKELTALGLECGTLEYGGSTGTTYQQVLQAGSYDIYLGQTKLSNTYDLSQFYKGWGNLGWGGIADNTLLNMCKESLANSGNYYNLNKMVADDGKIIPVLFGYYEVYAERGQLLDLSPSRDNVFFYTLGKTMESSRLATNYG